MVAPGLAAFQTTMTLHNAEMIGHPNATWGVTVGNPIHDAIRQIAAQTGVDFSVEVTLNRDHQITSVYAGDSETAHRAASRFAKSVAMQPVEEPFDVVVTTNSGYPLDMNLYQSVKGMSAAATGSQARRYDHLRGGVLRRRAGTRPVQQASEIQEQPSRAARHDPRARPQRSRPVAGTDPGPDSAEGQRQGQDRASSAMTRSGRRTWSR